jgi:O-antigen ligase
VQDAATTDSSLLPRASLAHETVTLGLAGLTVLCLQALFIPGHVPLALKVELALIVVITLIRPFAGLLATAALVPFSATATLVTNASHVLWADAAIFSFLASWMLAARSTEPRRQLDSVSFAGLLLGIIVIASCLAQVLGLGEGDFAGTVWRIASRDLFFVGRRTAGLGEGVALLQGLALGAAAVSLCRAQTKRAQLLAAALVGSAVVAAGLSILLSRGIGFEPVLARARLLPIGRFVAHVSDVNAAGSYFAMMACLAVGLATLQRGVTRISWVAISFILGVGMWLTASWAAVAAGLGMLALVLLHWITRALGRSLNPRLALVAMGLVLVLGLVLMAETRRILTADGFVIRRQFLETGLRMVASAPVAGVGVGMFHPLSRRFMGPQLGWSYSLENAHNYFLQITAELGVVGLGAFLYLLYSVWKTARSSIGGRGHLLAAVAGAGAFVATWLTGHPLLVREIGYPFWIVLALIIVWADEIPSVMSIAYTWRRQRVVLAATALIALASVPFRTEPPTRQTVMYGVRDWERLPDGSRARWTEQYATIVVRLETGALEIPMRAPETVEFLIAVDGVPLKYEWVANAWRQVQVKLPPPAPEVLYRRIDFRLPRTWTLADIQPGSSDQRAVGLQLGEISLSPVR